ncbi:MAG: Calx-beta domain-containing protein, partial [bacterium]
SVGENQTNALISLRRLGVTTTAFGVSFGTANGTGVAGSHYVATNGVLNFASGATSNAFQVRLIDDLVPLGDRTVNLSLSNPTGGAVLGPQSAAVLTINDNEVTLQFSAATFSVLEDQT